MQTDSKTLNPMIRKLSPVYVLAYSGFLMRCCPMAESHSILGLEFLQIPGGCSLIVGLFFLILMGTCCDILAFPIFIF